MMSLLRMHRILALPVAVVMLLSLGFLPGARAAMVPTEQVIAQSAAQSDRERVRSVLAREDVRRQMEAMGIDPEEATVRVAGLSDEEIRQIAGKLDQSPAGQGAVGAIVGAALIVFIILLITDLLCWTSVFPFTHCVAKK
jgi:Fe2+ transport system protein FeoA